MQGNYYYYHCLLLLLLGLGLLHHSNAQNDCRFSLNPNEFTPCIIPRCIGDTINITVNTLKPFEGIIHGHNRTEDGCFVYGRGGLKTSFRIDLPTRNGEPQNQTAKCGVRFNPTTQEHRVAIAVREHPTIELAKDKLFVVGCRSSGYTNANDEKSIVELRITRPEDTSRRPVSYVLDGEGYKLRVNTIDHDDSYGIIVHSCFAFSERENDREELINVHGCPSIKNIISEFKYNSTKGTAEADLTMFRLPSSNKTYFQCDVTLCKGSCIQPDCSREFNDRDFFERSGDSTLTTSTSVFVVEPGVPGSAEGHLFCPVAEDYSTDEYIKYLCIAFGILFLIMSLINICLCFTMTCSCTKSEVIEKEPSIYSIYDSQYGYATGKAYGSDSEYGSEYGAVDNQNYEEDEEYDDHRAPSDTDTYHSKYSSHHQRRH
eukprot:TRINITY_DN1618_c0_g1_i2.p1 TRINITY_DN1618_c0_g1~~TRINITY_DN1618_c0_g1_i2.p1  ORF type:complete len:430 (-),score=101.58 TRINITY_DN1618_c0_g1_i2:637-1926(-)